jgi:hypothetical protein
MAKIPRITAVPFGSSGTTDDFETFGSDATGTPVYSKDPTAIQGGPSWASGWRAALIASKAPVLQDMNGKMLVDSNFICYLMQAGIAEYDAGTTYYKDSVVMNSANAGYIEIYASLVDTNIGNALPTRVSNANWMFLYAMNTTALGLIIPGTQINDSAAAGNVGEYIESVTNGNCAATGVIFDATSISLTPGDWDVTGVIYYTPNGATFPSFADFILGISQTSGNSSTGLVNGSNVINVTAPGLSTFTQMTVVVPSYRQSLSATTTIYLKGLIATYSGATPTYSCRISARRMR